MPSNLILHSNLTVVSATWQTHRSALESLRLKINVTELRTPSDIEFDNKDAASKHILIQDDQQAIACGRITNTGVISRICVLKPYRKHGVGALVLKSLVEFAAEDNLGDVTLSAKLDTIDFYSQYGFIPHGNVFMKAGIPRRHASGKTDYILENFQQ